MWIHHLTNLTKMGNKLTAFGLYSCVLDLLPPTVLSTYVFKYLTTHQTTIAYIIK